MSTEMIVIVLLAWTVAGFLAAIAFGSMIKESDTTPEEEDDTVAASTSTVSYLRHNKRKPASDTRVRHSTAKRMTG